MSVARRQVLVAESIKLTPVLGLARKAEHEFESNDHVERREQWPHRICMTAQRSLLLVVVEGRLGDVDTRRERAQIATVLVRRPLDRAHLHAAFRCSR